MPENREKFDVGNDLFEPVRDGPSHQSIKATQHGLSILNAPLPSLDKPKELISSLVAAHEPGAKESLSNAVVSQHRTEPVRHAKRFVAETYEKACDEALPTFRDEKRELEAKRDQLDPNVTFATGERRRLGKRETLAETAKVVFYCSLLGTMLPMELTVAVSLLGDSGLALAESFFKSVAMSSVFICSPLIFFKFYYSHSTDEQQEHIVGVLKKAGLPLCFAGMWTFAKTVGDMQGQVDLLADVIDEPWIPFWVLSGISMTLLALGVLCVEVMLSDVWKSLQIYKEIPNKYRTALDNVIRELVTAIQETLALKVRAKQVLELLEHDEQLGVIQATALFQEHWNLQAKEYQKEEDEFNARLAGLRASRSNKSDFNVYPNNHQGA